MAPGRPTPARPMATPGLLLGPPPGSADFGPEARKLFARLTCQGSKPDGPCRSLAQATAAYHKTYLKPMRSWLKSRRPASLPETLLYPFSGGDLVSAVTIFVKQRQFVHLSLEHGGPATAMRGMSSALALQARWKAVWITRSLLGAGESFSVDLQKQEQAGLPGVLPMLLMGLYVHGGKPTGLSYFGIGADGKVKRYTRADLAAAAPKAKRHAPTWKDPRFSKRFSNLELRFRLPGDTQDRSVIHIAANLSNKGLGARPGVLAFLGRLGKHALMIKAASYLLWNPYFSQVRDRIFAKAVWGISDVTAPYPGWLFKNGWKIDAYGRFAGLNKKALHASSIGWRMVFRRAKSRHLPFRYGYPDKNGHRYVVLLRRAGATAKPARRPAPKPAPLPAMVKPPMQ